MQLIVWSKGINNIVYMETTQVTDPRPKLINKPDDSHPTVLSWSDGMLGIGRRFLVMPKNKSDEDGKAKQKIEIDREST